MTFHLQTRACMSFTFACHDDSAERSCFYGTSRLRVIISNSSPVRRTFVFLGPRCTQPLTPRNAHALRYEFSKWRICNEYSRYTLVRKAIPRKKDTKLYDIVIDMILNRYRETVSNLPRSAFNCLPPRLLAFLTAF